MAGQIIKRDESIYLVRIFLGRDEEGKRHFHNRTIHGRKKDAEKYVRDALRRKELGTFVELSAMTLDSYFDRWLESSARQRLSERTFKDYGEMLTRYARPVLGAKRLSDIRPLDIQNLYSEMQERGLSARTVRYVHAILSSALKQAVKWEMLGSNPASLVDLPRQTRKEMNALSTEEAGRFLAAAREDRLGIVFALAITTGMRPEEYLALQWKDVDTEKGSATIQRALIWERRGGGWYFATPKTSKSRRSIPLPASIVRELLEHKRHQNEQRLKLGPAYSANDLVFASEIGTPLHPRNLLRRHFAPIVKRAGLSSTLRPYDLRHSCATILLEMNEHPKVVSERLGHASITLTLDTYSHVLPSMQRAASDRLESALFGKTGTI